MYIQAETFQRIAELDYTFEEEDFAGISVDAKYFIENLFTREPVARWTAKQCLASDWIRKFSPIMKEDLNVNERETFLKRKAELVSEKPNKQIIKQKLPEVKQQQQQPVNKQVAIDENSNSKLLRYQYI